MRRNFILLPLLLILTLIVLSETSRHERFSECRSTSYACTDKIFEIDFDISYPFRERGMPDHCGLPGYDVTCKNNNSDAAMLVLEIDNKEYKVRNISYEDQTINLVNTDFLGDSCPLHLTNTTINLSRFSYTAHDLNLTLHFNCLLDPSSSIPNHVPPPPSNNPMSSCQLGSNLHDLYYSLPDDDPSQHTELLRICNSNALIPIPIWNVYKVRGLDFWGAIEDGFYLNWTSDATRWCKGCKDTGGICLRDQKSPGKPCCNTKAGKSKVNQKIVAAVAGVGGAFILGFCVVLFLYNRRKKQRQASSSNLLSQSSSSKRSSRKDLEFGQNSYNTHIFTYDELQEATNNFSESRELGDGGFGTVYKGKLHDGRTVAVKRLYENNYRRLEQFKNEVDILSRLRHPNLVSLYGCTSGRSRDLLLVYEYIPNGTLADHLHGDLASKELLPWPVRMSISIETADALAYLHSVEPQIIHRDVKTTNILVDNNFHVKVADFGLSRLFPLDATHVSTAPQGTPGYVDPEYHQCFQLTDKSDVYSFGVVLVELISSKPAVDISRHRHEINLANMAITKIQNGQIDQLVDPELGYQSDLETASMINQVAELAFRCLQSDGEMRPGIKEVLEVLMGIEGGRKKAEKDHTEVAEAHPKEETRLLKNVMPFSPDAVTEQWSSRSTTPNTSA